MLDNYCYSTCSLFLYICRNNTEFYFCTNMNAKEIAIIEAIIDKNDKRRHEKALKLLLYGEDKGGLVVKNEYVNCLESLVRKKFGNSVTFNDSYSTFASEFWIHLEKMSPDQLRSINNLKSWLFTVAKNFIETIRKEIEVFQLMGAPIDEGRTIGDVDGNSDDDVDNLYENVENDSEENQVNEYQIKSRNSEAIEAIPFDESEQERIKRLDFAKWRFFYYLNKITNETYKDILSAVYIEGVDRETLVEEYGWEKQVFNLTLDHARNAFIAVALEDIQRCGPQLFKKYEYNKEMDEKTANLLRDFFSNKYDVQQMALLYHKTNYEMRKALSVAYKRLLRIHKNETEILEKEGRDNEKKKKRMKRLYGIHKAVLEKEFPQSYRLLRKYYEDFYGDISAMTEWAMDNNLDVDELERQLYISFDALNAIDTESGVKENNSNVEDKNN